MIPDTQNLFPDYAEHLETLATWIVDNSPILGVEMVLHLGDVTNFSSVPELEAADAALNKIRNAGIPLLICIGNHDYDTGNPTSRDDTSKFNEYFGVHTFQRTPWFGGVYQEGKAENVYFKKSIQGEKFLFLALEFGPRDEVLDWADGVISKHPDHHVYIITHSYLYITGNWVKPGDLYNPKDYAWATGANDGQDMWEKLVRRHRNIRAVFSGHHVPLNVSHRFDKGVHGNTIFQSFQNWQLAAQGGQARIRVVHIDLEKNEVEVKTFNPVTKQYENLPGYTIKYKFLEGPPAMGAPANVAKVYDLNMNLVAYLENAATVGYEQPMNGLHRAWFTLPADDPKNAECLPMRYVELYEDGQRLDLYRIMPSTARRSTDGKTITYECEHVLGTLIDDVLFQSHTIGGLGVYTEDVLEYLLSKQTVKRWKLGTVAFNRQFEYNWENENLLNAIRSVPRPFVEEYMWTWDTSTYPWTLNLVEPSSEVDAYIRYGLNLQGIERQIDPRNLCTRLYGLGYGEGVNQLTFAEINDGKPYIDADTQDQFGIISDIFVDRRFEHPETLKARCEAILQERKMPRITYTVQAADISKITETPIHKFKSGGKVRVIDEDLGIDVESRVVNVRKQDMMGRPGDVELEISNKSVDIAGIINEMTEKQRINDLYAQGATNWDTHDFADNCDPEHPAVLRFWVPEDTARINKVMLSYQVEAFRAYSKSAMEGGQASITSEAGGGTLVTATIGNTYAAGSQGTYKLGNELVAGNLILGGGSGGWSTLPGGTDGHTHDIPPHSHFISHEHLITIPNHVHTVTLPNHTHGIDYGIFSGPTPTAVTVKVDGNVVPGLGTSADEVDIIPYLAKDSGGKIQRGTWHTIEIAPNSLGRVVASVVSQIFVQSRGGGNY